LVLTNVLIGMIYLPWVPTLLSQMRWARANFPGAPPGIWDAVYILATQVAGKPFPLATLFSTIGFDALAWPKVVGLVVVSLGAISIACAASRREWQKIVIALGLYGMIPIALGFMRSRTSTPIFIARIFIGSSAIIPLLASIPLAAAIESGVARLGARLSTAALVIVSILSVFAISSLAPNENWRAAYQYVKSHGGDDQTLLVFVGSEGELPFDYYAGRDGSSPKWARTGCPQGYFESDPPVNARRVQSDDDLERLKKRLAERPWKQIALVSAHNWWADPDHRVPTYLKSACTLQEQKEFSQIGVMLFAPPADKLLSEHAASPVEP